MAHTIMQEENKGGRPRCPPTKTVRADQELVDKLEELARRNYSRLTVEANRAIRLLLEQEGLLNPPR